VKVLYVEDEPFVRRDFERTMAPYASVVAVGTTQQALAHLRSSASWGALIFDLDLE